MLTPLLLTCDLRRILPGRSTGRVRSGSSQSAEAAIESLESRRLLAAVYHVALSGNDSSTGSESSPFRTLQKAADSVRAGDTVIVHAGTYTGFDLWTSGTAEARITFRAEPEVIINAANRRTADGINLEGASYVTIEGFTVVGVGRAGIRSVLNRAVEVRGNTCDQNGKWGIFSGWSEDILIERNTTTRSGTEHGIYTSNSADRPIIRDNVSWGNAGCGIHMNGDADIGGGDGIITGAVVERNVLYDNGRAGGSAINADGVQNSVFRNNLIYGNHAGGITLFRFNGGGGSSGNLVANNTVLQASDGRWAVNIMNGSTGNTVFNNILLTNHTFRGSVSVSADSLNGFRSDYNVVSDRFSADGQATRITLAQWRTATGQDAHSVVAAPDAVFANIAGGDYRLKAGSPAIDRGVVTFAGLLAPGVDLTLASRPQGASHDAGAYETVVAVDRPAVTDIRFGYGNGRWASAGSLGSRSAPWAITRIQVVFDADVAVDINDLVVNGTIGGGLAFSAFTYDQANRAATWTLQSPVERDELRVTVDGDGAGTDGNDGVTAVGAPGAYLESGDRVADVDVLFGDVDGNGTVNIVDMLLLRGANGTSDLFADLNGDGVVNIVDMLLLRGRNGTTLP